MKAALIGLSVMVIIFTLGYLMGSFVENSFNIGNWDEKTRAIVGTFGGMIAIVFGGASMGAYAESKSQN